MYAYRRPFTVYAPDPPAGGAPPADPAAAPPADPAAPPAPPADPAAPPAPTAPTPPDGWQPPTYAEVQAQQAAIAAANRRARELEAAAQAAETAKAAEAGQFKELYEAEQARAAELENGIKAGAVNAAVVAAAQRLGFANPTLATNLISLDGVDATLDADKTATVDQAAQTILEQRLNAVLTAEPYLKGTAPGRQLPGAGDPPAGGSGGTADLNAQIRRAAGRA